MRAEAAHCAQAPAELGLELEQRHVVPAPRGDLRRLQPSRPSAHDDDPAALRSSRRLAPLLSADVGVVEAGDGEASDHAVDAPLVGADAVANPPPRPELVHEVGVGDHRARHRDDVAIACLERPLGDCGIVDPARGQDGHAATQRVAEAVSEREELAEAVAVASDRACVVAGARALRLAHVVELAGVDEGPRDVLEPGHAEPTALWPHEVVGRDAQADDGLTADLVADAADQRVREGERISPLVVPLVAPGAERLLQQVAVRAVELDAVEARLDADPRRLRKAVDHLRDLRSGHPVHGLAVAADRVLHSPERLEVGAAVRAELPTEVVQLLHDLRAVPVQRRRHGRRASPAGRRARR